MKASLSSALVFFLVVSFFESAAQEYYVLQVKGTVTRKGVAIKSNEVIQPADKLTFSSPADAVAVMNPKTGRFIIKPAPAEKSSELVAYVKEAITPGNKKLSTRSGNINNVIDFQAYFNEPVLLLDEMRLPVNASSFPMNDKSFFFIRYTFNGEDINKKLSFDQQGIIISRSELYAVDGKPIDPVSASNLKLFYYKDNHAQQVSLVSFVTPDLNQLKQEVELIRTTYSTAVKSKIDEEILGYFNDFYGRTDQSNVDRWMAKK